MDQIREMMKKCLRCTTEWSRCNPEHCFGNTCYGCGEHFLGDHDVLVCPECMNYVKEEKAAQAQYTQNPDEE